MSSELRWQRREEPLPEGWVIEPHRTMQECFVCKNKELRIHAAPGQLRNRLNHDRVVRRAEVAREYAKEIDAEVAEKGTVVVCHIFYARAIYLKERDRMIVLGDMGTTGALRRADLRRIGN